MATKKTNKKPTKPKTRTSNKAVANSNTTFFKWWMVVILVVVIAVAGMVILRFSNAATYSAGSEIYVYCGQGICARSGTYYGNLNKSAGASLTQVTVYPHTGCDSGYVYGVDNLTDYQKRFKFENRNSLLCLNSGRRPS